MKHFRSITNANALARRFGGGGGGGGGGGTAWTNGGVVTSFVGNSVDYSYATVDSLNGTLPGYGSGPTPIGDGNVRGMVQLLDGNYAVSTFDNRILIVTTAGSVVTLAGNGVGAVVDNVVGTNASFNNPYGLAVLPNGNILVCDSGAFDQVVVGAIRMVTYVSGIGAGSGQVTTLFTAGGSWGGGGFFDSPYAICKLNSNQFVVTNFATNSLGLFTYPANTMTFITGYINTPGPICSVNVVPSNGYFVVTDQSSGVFLINPSTPNDYIVLAGNTEYNTGHADGTGPDALFFPPTGAIVLSDESIIVIEGSQYIRKITTTTYTEGSGVVTTIAGGDDLTPRDGSGTQFATFGVNDNTLCKLANGNVAFIGYELLIRICTPSGTTSTLGYSTFPAVSALAVVSDGKIVSATTDCLRLTTYPGAMTTTLAGGPYGTIVDGVGSIARFSSTIHGIAVLQNGNIAVLDAGNFSIRVVTYPEGVVSTLAGFGSTGYLDATGTAAKFGTMRGIGVLANGNIVVTDATNNRIRMITSGGVVTTLAGQTTGGTIINGIGTTARFSTSLRGLTVLQDGKIAVADSGNNAIRLVNPFTPTPAYSAATATAGSTVTTLATLAGVFALTTLPNGDIAATTTGGAVYIVNYATGTAGTVTALSGATGLGTTPYIATIPSTNLLIASDTLNRRIRLIT